MSISGSLATMQLGDLLQWCGANLKTGTLRLKRGPIEKQLFFKDGRLFSSVSTSPRETLGQFLIRSGHITEEELFKALIEQDRKNHPLGKILVASGLLTEEVLEDILRIKTEESIYDCFLWKDGDFMFEDGKLPEQIPISLPLDLTGVILEGARRTDEWERIHEVFPTRLTSFVIDHEQIEAANEISEEDRRVLELVARGKNLAEISLELHAVEFYAASRLLELHERKLVRVREAPEEIDYDAQVQALREKLKAGVGFYNSGQYEKGLTAFEEALSLDSQNKYARLFLIKIKRILEDRENVADIPLDGIPRLKVTMVELAQLDLDPQEGFVLSRVNGEWDVDSITKICPMGEQEVLIIFKRLVDQGLVEFGEKP
jgi:tetratricopeptide (TPR) repeat protein